MVVGEVEVEEVRRVAGSQKVIVVAVQRARAAIMLEAC
jgi:hypothetical protein